MQVASVDVYRPIFQQLLICNGESSLEAVEAQRGERVWASIPRQHLLPLGFEELEPEIVCALWIPLLRGADLPIEVWVICVDLEEFRVLQGD